MVELATHIPAAEFSPPPAQLIQASFATLYDQYRHQRRELNEAEVSGSDETYTKLRKTLDTKELLAIAALHLYDHCDTRQQFEDHLAMALQAQPHEKTQTNPDNEMALFGAYCTPLSLDSVPGKRHITSPVESMLATAKNFDLAQNFANIAGGSVIGMLMSGTNAYGAFYSVRGGTHPKLQAMGLSPEQNKPSDIDLLAVCEDIDAIEEAIKKYVDAALLPPMELRRFALFRKLYSSHNADIFSVRTHHQQVEHSIHFVPAVIAESISTAQPKRTKQQDDLDITILKDFRPNAPSNPRKYGGYILNDLKGLAKISFKPEIFPHYGENGTTLMGYTSETPAGSIVDIEGQQTYSLGVTDFFFAINPKILSDTNNRLERWKRQTQRTIADVQDGELPVYIPRGGQMTRPTLVNTKISLSLQSNEQ